MSQEKWTREGRIVHLSEVKKLVREDHLVTPWQITSGQRDSSSKRSMTGREVCEWRGN